MPRGDVGAGALALPAKQLDRLAKIAGLLSSDQPGEVVAAAAAGTRILREARLTWVDLVQGAASATPPPPRKARAKAKAKPDPAAADDWRAAVAECLARPDPLNAWERRFLEDLLGYTDLSAKQKALVLRLRERVRAGAAP